MQRRPAARPLGARQHFVLPDGSEVIVRAGPYGRGLTIVPVTRRSPGVRDRTPTGAPRDRARTGRPPRRSTLELRRRLASDLEAGSLAEPRAYIDWLVQTDDVTVPTARTVVYRELRMLRRGARPRRTARRES